MNLNRLLVVFVLAIITGCATTAPEFCDSAAWQERGFTHAMTGGQDQSEEARNDCAAKDAPLAYRIGFDYGLKKYCTFKRGLWAGEHGQGPAESCAEPKWDEYQNGYITGHQIFEVNSRLETISKELDSARSELWRLETSGENTSAPLVRAQQIRIDELQRARAQASRHLMNLRVDTRRQ